MRTILPLGGVVANITNGRSPETRVCTMYVGTAHVGSSRNVVEAAE